MVRGISDPSRLEAGGSASKLLTLDNRATLQRIIGFVLAALGGLFFLIGLQADGSGQGVFILLGLIAIALGIYLYWAAEDTKAGSVSITVRRVGDIPDRTWTFPRGQTEVPRAVSEEVARIHGPD
jgi:hypothetical protein